MTDPKRLAEVRLLVAATVDLCHPSLLEALRETDPTLSIAQVVADEVSSNLESVPYIGAAIVSRL